MANYKKFFVQCLFLTLFHVLFMHYAYSVGTVPKQYTVTGNNWIKDFHESGYVITMQKRMALHNNSFTYIDDVLVLMMDKDKNKGKYTTVQTAIEAVPKHSNKITLISIQPAI